MIFVLNAKEKFVTVAQIAFGTHLIMEDFASF
jgi:hypothetical protein